MSKIFVSFDAQDREMAQLAVTSLRQFNPTLHFFWTGDSLSGGESWFSQITENLKTSSAIVSLITNNGSGTNNWINFEVGAAIGGGKPLLVVLAPGITLQLDLSRPLRELQISLWSDTQTLSREFSKIGLISSPDAISSFINAFTPFKIERIEYGVGKKLYEFSDAERVAFERELENRKQIIVGNHLIGNQDPARYTQKTLFATVTRNNSTYRVAVLEGSLVSRSFFYR